MSKVQLLITRKQLPKSLQNKIVASMALIGNRCPNAKSKIQFENYNNQLVNILKLQALGC